MSEGVRPLREPSTLRYNRYSAQSVLFIVQKRAARKSAAISDQCYCDHCTLAHLSHRPYFGLSYQIKITHFFSVVSAASKNQYAHQAYAAPCYSCVCPHISDLSAGPIDIWPVGPTILILNMVRNANLLQSFYINYFWRHVGLRL